MRCADGRRPSSPDRMAVPPVWHSRHRELLSAVRPSDGGVGVSGSAESLRREIDSLRLMDLGARQLHRVRDHGLRGARVQSGVRGPRDPGDPVRRDREQRPRLQRELDPQRMGNRFVVVVPVDGRESGRLPPDGSAELGRPWILDAIVPSGWLRAVHGVVRLDMEVSGGLTSGWLFISVIGPLTGLPPDPDPNTAIGAVHFSGPTAWTTTPKFYADANLGDSGMYYLQVAFVANATSGPVNVGFDNVRLAWTTDAGVVIYIPAPSPFVVVRSHDRTVFTTYYGFLVGAILLAGGYYLARDRKDGWAAFRAPLEAIGRRLKSRSAWIAVAQVWMAITFFQLAVIYLLILFGYEPTNPINITPQNAWVFLYEFANAGVYEEFAFRLLLIGLPMALGSLIVRIIEVNRGTAGNGPGSAARHIAGAWRYLIGGVVRNDSPKEALAAAWALLFASSAVFGLAHAPSWGFWKVVPATVAGLGFGYLFLRHGIGVAILAHFVNDYAFMLYFEGVGGQALLILINLIVIGLAVAGSGFFAWYAIDAWRHLRSLIDRFRPRAPAAPVPAPPPDYGSAVPQAAASPGAPGPSMPPHMWSAPPPNPIAAVAVPNRSRIPRDYTPSYVPPPYGYPPVRFQCPYCAWVEARYDSGRFTCTRCGRTA